MVGDFVKWFMKFIKQTFCLHDYRVYSRTIGIHEITFYECKKCGRTKVTR